VNPVKRAPKKEKGGFVWGPTRMYNMEREKGGWGERERERE
jgi:hypothetical protein